MSGRPPSKNKTLTIEQHDINHISAHERHGQPRNQFSVRFSPVIYLAPIVVGGAAIPMGLGLVGSITAILAGNVLGALCTAACAAMGPRMGMPQLTMGRSAFGYHGNYLPAFLSLVLYLGYYTVGVVLGSQSLASLLHIPYIPVVIVVSVVSIVIALLGYHFFHGIARWTTWIAVVILAAVSISTIIHGVGTGAGTSLHGTKYWAVWLAQFTVVFGYTMSWSPYASDYSRYLPEASSQIRTFSWAFTGLLVGTTWMMLLGAAALTVTPSGDALDGFHATLPGWLLVLALLLFGLAAIPHNAVNLYSNAMTTRTWSVTLPRTAIVAAGGIIGCVVAIFVGGTHFVDILSAFLSLVTYYVMPWLAILLIDFYWTHRSGTAYRSINDFYIRNGLLKGVNWAGGVSFIAGIGISVPFMATDMYTGPVGYVLGGIDVSYFVSFAIAGLLYLTLTGAKRVHIIRTTVPDSPVRNTEPTT